ncbi:MAG: hypothetical protein AAF989_02490 [Planctomycetota bacterium]
MLRTRSTSITSDLLVFSALRIVSTLMLLIVCDSLQATEDSPARILEQAIQNRGDRVIRTGEFNYTLTMSEGTPTDDVVDQRVKQVRAALQEQLQKHKDNPDFVNSLQQAIDSADEYVPEQVIANSQLQIRHFFVLGGQTLGGDRYIEASTFKRDKAAYGPARKLLYRSLGSGRGASVDLDPLTQMTIVGTGGKAVYQPSQEPHRLGRINGTIPMALEVLGTDGFDQLLSKSVSELGLSRFVDDSGTTITKLTCKSKVARPDNPLAPVEIAVTYHVIPERGFVTPLVRESTPDGLVLSEWVCKDYIHLADSDLWFPLSCEYRASLPGGRGNSRVERYAFEQDGVRVNQRVPKSRFAVAIAPNTPVVDSTVAEQTNYVTTRAIDLSIDDTAHLSELDGLRLRSSPTAAYVDPHGTSNATKVIFVCLNVIVFLGIARWLIRGRRSPDAGHA